MRDAFSIISALHNAVNSLEISIQHGFAQLPASMLRNDLAPHPDDLPELQLIMRIDAMVLRRLADQIDVARTELQNDNIVYMNAGA